MSSPLYAVCKQVKSSNITFGDFLCNIKLQSFRGIEGALNAGATLAGVGCLIAAVFKMKQVKDNPTQIPVSTPIALLAVAALFLAIPGLYKPVGQTLFGESVNDNTAANQGKKAITGTAGGFSLPNLVD